MRQKVDAAHKKKVRQSTMANEWEERVNKKKSELKEQRQKEREERHHNNEIIKETMKHLNKKAKLDGTEPKKLKIKQKHGEQHVGDDISL